MQKGFFASLFDVSFKSLVATRVIKVLYVIALIVIGLTAVGFVIAAFNENAALGALTLLVLAPLAALIYTIYIRVALEVVIAIFRIMENTGNLYALQSRKAGIVEPPPGPEGAETS